MMPKLTEDQFQDTVLKGMTAQKETTDSLVANYGQLQKETKAAFEDLTLLKRTANDSAAGMVAMQKAIADIQRNLRNELRLANGNPVERIRSDEEMRLRMNMAIRLSMDSGGDMIG